MPPIQSPRLTQAEDTTDLLQHAAHNGLPILIPGAFEMRAGGVHRHVSASLPPSAVAAGLPSALTSDERTSAQLEGGGAPGERRRPEQRTLTARLRRLFFLRP